MVALALFPSAIVQHRQKLLIPSAIFAAAVFVLMKMVDSMYTNTLVPLGQVSLQLAFTERRARMMVRSLDEEQIYWAYVSVYLDYVFMFAYGVALITGVVYRGLASEISIIVASVVVVAVVLDAFEGLGILALISNPNSFHPALPAFIGLIACSKFILLAIPIVFIVRPFGIDWDPTHVQKRQ